jgi:hypothetical protein
MLAQVVDIVLEVSCTIDAAIAVSLNYGDAVFAGRDNVVVYFGLYSVEKCGLATSKSFLYLVHVRS